MVSPMMFEEVHTDIHGLHRIPKMSCFAAFSREIGRSKSDD